MTDGELLRFAPLVAVAIVVIAGLGLKASRGQVRVDPRDDLVTLDSGIKGLVVLLVTAAVLACIIMLWSDLFTDAYTIIR